MSKNDKHGKVNSILSVTIVKFLISIFTYLSYSTWTSMSISGYSSCLASVAEEINKNKSRLPIVIKNDWTILSSAETDEIFAKIEPYDCAKNSDPSIDLWDNKIQVALRKTEVRTKLIVWSKGADGVSRTNDDIVVPLGKLPPK